LNYIHQIDIKIEKIQLLEQHNIPPIGYYVLYSAQHGENPISEELLKFLRIFLITKEEDLEKAPIAFENKPISLESELRVFSILSAKINQTLTKYETTIEEDRQIESDTSDYIEKQLRKFLISEKEILLNTLSYCNTQKDILKGSMEIKG